MTHTTSHTKILQNVYSKIIHELWKNCELNSGRSTARVRKSLYYADNDEDGSWRLLTRSVC